MLLRRWALYCAVALALSGCSSEPAQEPTPVVPVTVESPQVVEDAASFFFEAPQRVAVAAADPAAQQAAARYAVAEGIPMLADAANATRVAHIEVFGAPALPDLGDAEVSEHEVSADATADRAAAAIELAGADSPTPASGVTALVTAATPLADVASARAAGARVLVLPVGDPRATADSLAAAAEGNVVALGPDFGSQETFARAAGLARNGELPGGGLVFPGRRMVALYGHPSDGALGALGEQDPAASVARVRELGAQYQELSAEPVVPAFEIIATVASGAPGPDGGYSNESDPAELVPYVDAITAAGGYAVLNLQPGRARLLDQAQRYAELLRRPGVGLALDPEWKLGPGELPMTDVGHVEAAEINEVADWLAALTRDAGLPQKAFVIHQFQQQMIRDRDTVRTDHPELAIVLHVDGHGRTSEKLDTWNVIRQDLQPGMFLAWKNFYDEDQPLLSPAETFSVEPRPWFVSYQ